MTLARKIFTCAFILFATLMAANNIEDIDSLNSLSYDLGNSYPDSAYVLAHRSAALSQRINYINGEIIAYCRMGRVVYKKGILDSALVYFNSAENLFYRKGKDSLLLAKVFIYQGLVHRKNGDYDLSIAKYDESCRIATANNNHQLCGQSLININNIHKARGDYSEAIKVLNRALTYMDTSEYNLIGAIYQNRGNIFELQKRYNLAIQSFSKAFDDFEITDNNYARSKILVSIGNIHLKSMKLDSALLCYNEAEKIAIKKGFDQIISQIYHNKGEYFFQAKNLDKALNYFNKSLEFKKQQKVVAGQSITYERIGDILRLQNKPEKSLESYLESFRLCFDSDNFLQLSETSNKLSSIYSDNLQFQEAFKYLKLSKQYQDSIADKLQASLKFEIRYNTEKNKVDNLNIKLKAERQNLDKQKIINWLWLGLASIAMLFLILVNVNLKQAKDKIAVQNKNVIIQKEIDSLLTNQDQVTINAMLEGQETERNRIAGELHDKLGSILSMVKLYFKSIDKQIDKLKAENIKQYHKANELLDEACDEARKIAYELSSGNLSKLGLFKAINGLKNKIEGSGEMKVNLHTFGTDDDLKVLNEIAVYRIVQELISNSLKYANAREINIQLNVFDDIFNLIVEDDGQGFEINSLKENSGFGLRNIEARVKNMDGLFSIDTGLNRGTTVSIDIPLKS